MNQRFYTLFIISILFLALWSCDQIKEQSWTSLIPQESILIYAAESDPNFENDRYPSVLDDLTPTALQQVSVLQNVIEDHSVLKALVLYPATSTHSEFIWINETSAELSEWASSFYEPFKQNEYSFQGTPVHTLTFGEFQVYAAQIHNWLIFSPSSRTLESSLRSYRRNQPPLKLSAEPEPGKLILNAGSLDNWIEQFVNVKYRPSIVNAFKGLEPVQLNFSDPDGQSSTFRIDGSLPLADTDRSVLVEAIASQNKPITLDRYIASSAGAFAILRRPVELKAPIDPSVLTEVTALDSLLLSDGDLYRDVALTIDDEFAVVTFPESGLLATGEYLFLRNIQSAASFRSQLSDWSDKGLITATGNSYFIRSSVLAELLGSSLVPFSDFYLSFSGDVAVLSRRKGLSESVESDRSRRRVMYYNSTFASAKKEIPESVSAFIWSKTDDLLRFLEPILFSGDQVNSLLGSVDITLAYFEQLKDGKELKFSIQTLTEEGSTQPYDERWVLPLKADELSGVPILADIVGSSAKEVLVATQSGEVIALAYDGTVVMNAETGNETPIGSPIVYDWYGNGQPIIMIAAGTKIYAWNESGNPLPQFPLEIGERISAPILVTDVLRNGIPEIIVATESRKIHVIDGRGQDVRGWPQFTNGIVSRKPVFAEVDGTWSIWVFSENILHSWLRSGATRPAYPTFINAPFTTSPVIYKDQILASATDGYIYSSGKSPSFRDSLSVSIQMDSVSIKAIYASNSALNTLSVTPDVLLRNENGFFRSDLISAQSVNGSLFLFNPQGQLMLTYSLGQPSSSTYQPQIIDLNNDNKKELVALADFGRLFAWDILTGERIFNIPTSGMKYPLIEDMNGDSNMELIALTREGLRCWTINTAD